MRVRRQMLMDKSTVTDDDTIKDAGPYSPLSIVDIDLGIDEQIL
jgi:hypothetical protein